jgi:hypothetical protein
MQARRSSFRTPALNTPCKDANTAAGPPVKLHAAVSSRTAPQVDPLFSTGTATSLPTSASGIPVTALFQDDNKLASMRPPDSSAMLFQLLAWASEALQGMLARVTEHNLAAREELLAAQAELFCAREKCDSILQVTWSLCTGISTVGTCCRFAAERNMYL